MHQRTFFEQDPVPPSVPVDTSEEAAEAIRPSAHILRGKVLAYIEGEERNGATDDEVQRALGMNGNTERPRRSELETMGFLVRTDRRRKTSSGRNAVVFMSEKFEDGP